MTNVQLCLQFCPDGQYDNNGTCATYPCLPEEYIENGFCSESCTQETYKIYVYKDAAGGIHERPYKVCLPICERFTIVQSENDHNMYHYDYKYCPAEFYSCPAGDVKKQFLVPENTELSNAENCV